MTHMRIHCAHAIVVHAQAVVSQDEVTSAQVAELVVLQETVMGLYLHSVPQRAWDGVKHIGSAHEEHLAQVHRHI